MPIAVTNAMLTRRFVWLLTGLTAWATCSNFALAASYPDRPVRVIVPFAAGGGVDSMTRLVAQKLSEHLGTTFVVDNRPGAAGMLGTRLAAQATADGHTLLTSAPEFAINPVVRRNAGYDPLRDFAFISQLTAGQYMLVRNPSVQAETIKDLLALAKSRPGALNFGSSGAGGITHLSAELLQSMSGIRWTHVPFKGTGPALTALLAGDISFIFAGTTPITGLVRAGKLRPLAVTGTKRLMQFPDVPTIAESGVPGYEVTGWYGFYAPAGTPRSVIQRLHSATTRALKAPEVIERLSKTGNEPVGSSPAEFGAFVRGEVHKWRKVVTEIGLTLD